MVRKYLTVCEILTFHLGRDVTSKSLTVLKFSPITYSRDKIRIIIQVDLAISGIVGSPRGYWLQAKPYLSRVISWKREGAAGHSSMSSGFTMADSRLLLLTGLICSKANYAWNRSESPVLPSLVFIRRRRLNAILDLPLPVADRPLPCGQT